MKRIDRKHLHDDPKDVFVNGLQTVSLDKNGNPVVRKTLSLPRKVHAATNAIAYKTDTTLKKVIVNALTEMLNDNYAEFGKYDFSDTANPSVILPQEIYQQIRKIAHDKRFAKRTVITEALVRYIKNRYMDQASDIPEIQDL
jgi:hypothetical protein